MKAIEILRKSQERQLAIGKAIETLNTQPNNQFAAAYRIMFENQQIAFQLIEELAKQL